MTVLDDLSRRANAFVPTGLRPFVQEQLTREKSKAGEHFDNIFAVRRLFDHALRRAKARGVQNSITLTREDFAVAV